MAKCMPPQGFMPHGEYIAGHWSRRKPMTQPTYYLGNYSSAKFMADEKEKQEHMALKQARKNTLIIKDDDRDIYMHEHTPNQDQTANDLTTQILDVVNTNPDWYVSDEDPVTGRHRLSRGGRMCTETGKYLPSRFLRRQQPSKRGKTIPLSTFTGFNGDVAFFNRIIMADWCQKHEDDSVD